MGPILDTYLHDTYQPGHFIASFSGCMVLIKSREHCNALFEQYADVAEAALAV
jgi:hypothetical protein